MSPHNEESFNPTRWQSLKWPRSAKPAFDSSEYRDLLRHTSQLAAEGEIAAGLLGELSKQLRGMHPQGMPEQHERVESAIELLQRL